MDKIPLEVLLHVVSQFIPETFFTVNRSFYKSCVKQAMLKCKRASLVQWLTKYARQPKRAPYFTQVPVPIFSDAMIFTIRLQLDVATSIAIVDMNDSVECRSKYDIIAIWQRPNGGLSWLQVNDLSDFAIRREGFTNVGPLPNRQTKLSFIFKEIKKRAGYKITNSTTRDILTDQLQGKHIIRLLPGRFRYVMIEPPVSYKSAAQLSCSSESCPKQ